MLGAIHRPKRGRGRARELAEYERVEPVGLLTAAHARPWLSRPLRGPPSCALRRVGRHRVGGELPVLLADVLRGVAGPAPCACARGGSRRSITPRLSWAS